MAGVSNAILAGWKVPVVYRPVADHTYVRSDCGLTWGCYGNRSGGTIVSSANGNSAIADCIAGPNGMAGIRWNRNGWCHQIANRILHPAGITIAGVSGYGFSRFKFGVYGRNLPPPNLSPCYRGGLAPLLPDQPLDEADMASFLRAPARRISPIAEVTRMDEFHGPNRVQELADLVRATPGLVLSEQQFTALAQAQGRLWEVEDDLGVMLDNDEISPEIFAERSTAHTAACMRECETLIGTENFARLFGEAGRSPEGIMDQEAFVADHERHHPHTAASGFRP